MGYFAQTLTTNKMLCTLLVIELSMSYMMVMGEVYKVGDSAGWDVNSNLDYQSWASSKTFRVDDVLLFEYNATNENVIEVTHSDFRSCNTSTPIKVFNSGNDSFTIKAPGHYFFTSNLSEHCKAGQKIDVRVLKTPPPYKFD
ncbi:cupredoxin superfamily protein [Artemisia annua]|uniref:Cupredoxin superfamily protein n=1 Tax=Artemisia annua TaxID=35608 RepID=A0A2U1M928_ARTAN|nr:cupredoxin superfamily protein [Artemisia annua]